MLGFVHKLEETVVKFLERDDNLRMMPGKPNYKKHEGEKVQKRYLNDYCYNMYAITINNQLD